QQQDWLLFAGEMASHPAYSSDPVQAAYEVTNGWWTDLWVTNPTGTAWYNLTSYSVPGGSGQATGVLSPHFSPDGTKIAWAQIVNTPVNTTTPVGTWQLWEADFVVNSGVPSVQNLRNLSSPQSTWFEIEDWSPDGSTLLVSSDIG